MNQATKKTVSEETSARIPVEEQVLMDRIAKIKAKKNPSEEEQDTLAQASDDLKARKFVRLAEARVTKACKSISLIGNLSGRSQYLYTDEQVKAIENALIASVSEALAPFKKAGDDSEDKGFSFG